jgi:hypothetical protein
VSYLDLEADAGKISVFATDIVPRRIQTAGFAAAVTRASRPGLTTSDSDRVGRLRSTFARLRHYAD